VVVRTWNGHEYGHGDKTALLTYVPVDKPLQPFDDDDARSPIGNCGIKEAEQPWDVGHPPQKTERAVLVHIVFSVLTFALATKKSYADSHRANDPPFTMNIAISGNSVHP
jgi:hypothetical protein